jgi:hypothetical protein
VVSINVTAQHWVVRKLLATAIPDALFTDTIELQILEAGMIVTAFEEEPEKAWLWLIWVEQDDTVMLGAGPVCFELRVFFADDLVDRPVHLLTSDRAVMNGLATAANHLTSAIAHCAYELCAVMLHGD